MSADFPDRSIPLPATCLHCSSKRLYTNQVIAHPTALLAGLGAMFSYPKFDVVICGECGHVMLFADQRAISKLADSDDWQRLWPQE